MSPRNAIVEAVGGKDNVQIYGQSATVIASSDKNAFDLAVIKVKDEKLINRPVLKLQNYSQEGTSVKAAGYYLYSEENKRSLATIKGVLGKQKYREDQDTGERAITWEININSEDQLQKGYSGSPVVDQDSGLVIGVVTNMGTGGQTGEMISVEALEIICPWLIGKLIEIKSERGVDYSNLQKLLAEGKWDGANYETGKVMCQAAGRDKERWLITENRWLRVEDIDNFPCEDLRTINQLWLHYSKGKFGFSVQKEIYESLGGTRKYDEEVWQKFSDCVGWRKGENCLHYSQLIFDTIAPRGHLPRPWLANAIGHYGQVMFGRWVFAGSGHSEDKGEGISSLIQRLITCSATR
jgi:hypothetical protein